MSKFNRGTVKPAGYSPVTTEFVPSGRTYQGGPGYARDTRSRLFLLAVTNMVGEQSFYESATERDTRYTELVHRAAVEDPDWTARFLRWLRADANMRTASLVGAAEFVKARLRISDGEQPVSNRAVIASVLQRADEPGELLAYWTSVHGRAVPKPVKRGIADAVVRLYDEQASDNVASAVPARTPLYTWNLAGYQHGHAPSGSRNRHTFGGLTDQAFRMIPLIEAGRSANWPF